MVLFLTRKSNIALEGCYMASKARPKIGKKFGIRDGCVAILELFHKIIVHPY